MAHETPTDPVVPWRGTTRAQYDALVDTGLLEGEPVELLEGDLVEVTPQGEWHADVVAVLTSWSARRLPEPWVLRGQLPLAATDTSEPEPDLAVAERTIGSHPSTAALAVHVPAREVVVHTDPGPHGYGFVRRQQWTAPPSVPVGDGIDVDLAGPLSR